MLKAVITDKGMPVATNSLFGVKLPVEIDLHVDHIIVNDPAVIVFWGDGVKTVVKCGPNDTFDPEKGIAMCYMKRVLGNRFGWYNTMTRLLKKAKVQLDENDTRVV